MSSQNREFLTPSPLLVVFLLSKIGNFWHPLPPCDDIVYGRPLIIFILKFTIELAKYILSLFVKLIFSEKAKRFEKRSYMDLTLLSKYQKQVVDFFSNFVDFLENLNFNYFTLKLRLDLKVKSKSISHE